MKIKSLLLGSAAALVAASGARAADAVMMAQPEPVDYVRVCDAYGTGFFYIPGTETCLRFDGYVRYQINAQDDAITPSTFPFEREDGWGKTFRTRLNIDARSDTEWGTLRGWMRLQADSTAADGSGDASVGIDQAIVALGGFYAGYTESVFAAPYGVPGIARFGILHTDSGGQYAYQERHQIGYTFSGGNGLFGSVAMEDDAKSPHDSLLPYLPNPIAGDNWVPNFTGSLGVSQGWGGVWAKAGYDESASDGAITVGLHYNVPGMAGSSLRIGGFWASGAGQTVSTTTPSGQVVDLAVDPNSYAVGMPISGSANPAEWSIAAGYHQQFNPQWGAEFGGQYMEDFNSGDGYLLQAAVIWVPVTNFEIRLEGHYNHEDSIYTDAANYPGFSPVDDSNWDGFLRFARYF